MTRAKIDYAIDLGTTNSAIAVMTHGNIKIIKSDKLQKDTTPSCVFFNKKQTIFVGDDAYQGYKREAINAIKNATQNNSKDFSLNAFIEFKRTMGTDKSYSSSHMDRSFSSEALSAEVLKKLKSYVTDEEINAAVITVPAKFLQHQVDATQRAADLAGFGYVELLQEPIAASMAYGIEVKVTDGHWLVFDFGGGTFDAALMKVDEGIIKVVDTEGDNQLGGKDLDYAIVDHILIPYLRDRYEIKNILSEDMSRTLLREALKFNAEEAKIVLSSKDSFGIYVDEPIGVDDKGEEIEIDLTVTLDDYEKAVKTIFQRAIDLTLKLLKNKNLKGSDLETLILVGGPTYSQPFRRMLVEQITPKIDTSIDPMTAVAVGAALFASTKDIPIDLQKRDRTKIQLILKYPETTVEIEENLGIRIGRGQSDGAVPKKIFAEITRSDKGWSSGRFEVEDDAEIITIQLNTGKPNGFAITLFDEKGTLYPCEPDRFTIIQGLKTPNATLPFDICIDALDTQLGKQRLQGFSELEKNQPLPAKGKNTYKTQKNIRPGNKQDIIRIPVFNGDHATRAIYNNPLATIVITGEELPDFLPKDSDVEITLEVDSSRRITLTVYFPYIDHTLQKQAEHYTQKEFDADIIEAEINKAKQTLVMMEDELASLDADEVAKLNNGLNELSDLLESGRGDHNTKTKITERLRGLLKEIDKLQDKNEWPRVEEELNDALSHVEMTNERYGNEKTTKLLAQFEQQAQEITDNKNINLARELTSEIWALDFAMVREQVGLWISYIKGYDEDFDIHGWTNRNVARMLINEAIDNINTGNPSKEVLEEIVRKLFKLLPENTEPFIEKVDDELLKK